MNKRIPSESIQPGFIDVEFVIYCAAYETDSLFSLVICIDSKRSIALDTEGLKIIIPILNVIYILCTYVALH